MTSHQLILAAAAGAVSLAICAVLWALAQRRQAQDRVDVYAARLGNNASAAGAGAPGSTGMPASGGANSATAFNPVSLRARLGGPIGPRDSTAPAENRDLP